MRVFVSWMANPGAGGGKEERNGSLCRYFHDWRRHHSLFRTHSLESSGTLKPSINQKLASLIYSLQKQTSFNLGAFEKKVGDHTSFRESSMFTVFSQSTQASVMLTPCFNAAGPAAGTSWRPSLMLDSIITPVMFFSPAASCSQILAMTSGWFLWFFCELPSRERIRSEENKNKLKGTYDCNRS